MTTRGFSIIKEASIVEPISLELLKKYVEIDSDDHNALLNVLLTAARKKIESFLCVSLVETNITVSWEELTSEELPYGPVQSIISVKDAENGNITTHTIEGLMGSFVTIKANRTSKTVINYVAGYPDVPEEIQLSIMKLAVDNFEQRTGINLYNIGTSLLPGNWKDNCRSYRRIPWSA